MILYEILGEGHAWPGGPTPAQTAVLGQTARGRSDSRRRERCCLGQQNSLETSSGDGETNEGESEQVAHAHEHDPLELTEGETAK